MSIHNFCIFLVEFLWTFVILNLLNSSYILILTFWGSYLAISPILLINATYTALLLFSFAVSDLLVGCILYPSVRLCFCFLCSGKYCHEKKSPCQCLQGQCQKSFILAVSFRNCTLRPLVHLEYFYKFEGKSPSFFLL